MFAGLIAILIYLGSVAGKYAERRETLFCQANGFVEIEMGTKLSGDLRKDGAIEVGYSLASVAGEKVYFGVIRGWFDKDHKAPKVYGRYGSSEEELRLFVSVDARDLEQEVAYFSPDRPVVRDQVPMMNIQALQALSELARKYAVVVGAGSITVSAAGGSLNSASESMQFIDLSQDMAWKLIQRIIGEKLATVVEGLGTEY